MAAFILVGAFSGSVITYLLGVLGDSYDVDNNPDLRGKLLGAAVLISYIGCIPFFLVNAREYARIIKY